MIVVDYSTEHCDAGEFKDGKKAMGDLGESLARGYLKRKGYSILVSPFSCKSGEIDIIARDGDCLVFAEVKTRRSKRYGHSLEAMTPAKKKQVIRVARYYLRFVNKWNFKFCRFDVLGIDKDSKTGENTVQHIENAFSLTSW